MLHFRVVRKESVIEPELPENRLRSVLSGALAQQAPGPPIPNQPNLSAQRAMLTRGPVEVSTRAPPIGIPLP
jgi:hypothetical protein